MRQEKTLAVVAPRVRPTRAAALLLAMLLSLPFAVIAVAEGVM